METVWKGLGPNTEREYEIKCHTQTSIVEMALLKLDYC